MHLSVLVETMRREGYELTIGQPLVIIKEIDGVRCEPYENLVIDIPQEFASKAIDLVTQRKGDLLIMETKGDNQHMEFEIPSRGDRKSTRLNSSHVASSYTVFCLKRKR